MLTELNTLQYLTYQKQPKKLQIKINILGSFVNKKLIQRKTEKKIDAQLICVIMTYKNDDRPVDGGGWRLTAAYGTVVGAI